LRGSMVSGWLRKYSCASTTNAWSKATGDSLRCTVSSARTRSRSVVERDRGAPSGRCLCRCNRPCALFGTPLRRDVLTLGGIGPGHRGPAVLRAIALTTPSTSRIFSIEVSRPRRMLISASMSPMRTQSPRSERRSTIALAGLGGRERRCG
jgi:hypothetical protein